MSSVTVRNLPEATHRALKHRAAQHGRSTEAEIRHILEAAVQPGRGLGSALAALHGLAFSPIVLEELLAPGLALLRSSDLHIQITGRAPVHARFAFTGEPHAVALVHSGGDFYR